MNTESQCPHCGSALPPDVPPGLCARCLLATAAPTLAGIPADPEGGPLSSGPFPGREFGGYRILRLLGKGGMGEVWEAEQNVSGRRVALKVMHRGLASEEDRKRFLREGRLAASVSHPNVVYVYGSEEIEGVPAITMELACEETLKDLVARRGPLPVADAIDYVLQAMAGLEAAEAVGVLHRDIKPGNCFLGDEGEVKVGDFGLSISTLAMGESMLTAAGSVFGTPSFASPEQLRGEELDVRSDIYSVGATLYFLVTGHAPVEGNDLVKLIAAVLDQPPVPPSAHRGELPGSLDRIILRCLAKNPGSRYGSYAELARSLMVFGGSASTPALLGRRFLAGMIDEMVVTAPSIVLAAGGHAMLDERFLAERSGVSALILGGLFLWGTLYYGVCESVWGAALGKRICGLRVIVPGKGIPDFRRAALRAFLFEGMLFLPVVACALVLTREVYEENFSGDGLVLTDFLYWGAVLLVFASARRRNGFAGLHELASGTRVIAAAPMEERRQSGKFGTAEEIPDCLPERLGPYGVVGNLADYRDGSRLVLGYDEILRRKVWLHRVPDGCDPVAPGRRDLHRGTRLRWLQGRRMAGDSWDAYEAPDGTALATAIAEPRPWREVRHWLGDLAEEMHAGMQRGMPAPDLSADRIWICGSGRALVLDFPVPGDVEEKGEAAGIEASLGARQRFLAGIADMALGLRKAVPLPEGPPPPGAIAFLRRLGDAAFESLDVVRGNLRSLGERPTKPQARFRIAAILAPLATALVFALGIGFQLRAARENWERAWTETFPGAPALDRVIRQVEDQWYAVAAVEEDDADYGSKATVAARTMLHLQIFTGTEFDDILTDDVFWTHPDLGRSLTEPMRGFLRDALPVAKAATEEESEAARAAVGQRLDWDSSTEARRTALYVGAIVFWYSLIVFAVVGLLLTLVFGQPPVLRLCGLVVVDRNGLRASRSRLFLRWLVGWGIPVALLALLADRIGERALEEGTADSIRWLAIALVVAGGYALGHLTKRPWRGWHDALSGTFVATR